MMPSLCVVHLPGTSKRPAKWLAAASVCLLLCARGAYSISVEGPNSDHTDSDVDPEEFLWSQLPGRCCMQLREKCPYADSPREDCTIEAPDTCSKCEVWSEPDNYCHTSEDDCYACGMSLWCGKPPPLIAGNKVCVGTSRVGAGCWDDYGTGICANRDIERCQQDCRDTKFCEMFVYYPLEKKGSCILCSDLFHSEPSGESTSRAYTITAAPPPPITVAKAGYEVVIDSPPPVIKPPLPPAPPAPSGPPSGSTLGRGGAGQAAPVTDNVECSFSEGIEFAVDRSGGYTDGVASTREECCNLCGRKIGCTDFVFQPSTGQCVLLPSVPVEELEKRTNLNVVSGSMRIAAAAKIEVSTHCTYQPDKGFSGTNLGPGRLPLNRDIQTRQDCCDACGRHDLCRKFTFNDETHQCVLFQSFAELYSLPLGGMLAGVIDDGVEKTSIGLPPSPPRSSGEESMPRAPAFTSFMQAPPPPPPVRKIGETQRTQGLIGYLSMAVIALMTGVLCCFMYCFYSPEVMALMYTLSSGKMGKKRGRPDARAKEVAATVAEEPRRRKRGGGLEEGYCKVIVQTDAMTQSKAVLIETCSTLSEVKSRIFEEFKHVLKDAKPSQALLLCQVSASDSWLLVSEASNFQLAREKARIWKLVLKREGDVPEWEVAFPKEGKRNKCESPSTPVANEDGDESTSLVTQDSGRSEKKGGKRAGREKRVNGKCKGASDANGDDQDPTARLKRAVFGDKSEQGRAAELDEDSTDDEVVTSRTQLVPAPQKRTRGAPGLEIVRPKALREPSVVSGWEDDEDLTRARRGPQIQDDGML